MCRHSFSNGLVSKYNTSTISGNYWIGLTDVQETGIWIWMTSKTRMSTIGFSSWNSGEPNHDGNENCVTMDHGIGGNWNNLHCSGEVYYICEKGR